MSLAPITLTTNKSTAVIDNAHRKLRQDESGLSITVTVLNEDNTAYDLTGKNLVFCENKEGNKVIVDDGKGDNSGKFNRNSDNDTKGIFTYVLQEDAYAASGVAWFEINDGTTVDSTKNFYLDVEKDGSVSLPNNDYIGTLKALETAMAGAQAKVTSDLADMEAQITQQIADTKTASENEITQAIKKLTDQTTAALSNVDEYTQKLTTLQSQWDAELQSIQTKAGTDTDAAVKAINDRYTNDFAKLQSDFTNWQTSTTQNYQKQVDAILAQVQGDGTEVANLQKQVDDTVAKMQDLNKQFSNIDFTQFLKPSALDNYYTKAEVDGKLTTVGAVKTVDGISPDATGNVQTDHYTKAEVDSKTSGTVVTDYDVANKNPTKETDSYNNKWLVDQNVLGQFADQINQLKGRRTVDAPDFNTLTDTGVYYVSNPKNGKNFPSDNWGTLAVFSGTNGSDTRTTQFYVADDGTDAYVRIYGWINSANQWGNWNQLARKSDITNLQNAVNNIDSTRTPIVTGNSGDDLFAFKTNQIRLYNGNGSTCKNLPPVEITNWFTVQYLFEGPTDNGIAIYRTPQNEIWTAGCNGGSYNTGWVRVANATDITNLQNQMQAQQTAIDSLKQNSLKMVPITQTAYDALSTKDPNTIYVIGG